MLQQLFEISLYIFIFGFDNYPAQVYFCSAGKIIQSATVSYRCQGLRNTKSGDMCVVYDVRFGFIVLEYYMDGYFENNSNYDNTEDLYQHLLDKWKFCWIVDKALAHFEAAFRQIQTE